MNKLSHFSQMKILAEKIIELELGLDTEGISSGVLDDDEAYKIILNNFPDIKKSTENWLDWSELEVKP